MKRFLFDCGSRESAVAGSLLFLRVATGLMMLIGHGLPKIQNYAEIKDRFYVPSFFPLRFLSPPLSLLLTIGAEVGCAALLILGLLTRPSAFVLAFVMVIAAFGLHHSHPWFVNPAAQIFIAKELALMYLIPFLALMLSGAGAWSLDAKIYRTGRRRKW